MENLPEFINNHMFLVSLFVALLAMLIWNIFGGTMSGIEQVSPQELTRLINHENGVVIDLRSAEDFSRGHILHANNIPEPDLVSREKELQKLKGKPVITCCLAGTTAPRAARALKAKEFEKVYALKGGIQAWQAANLPLTRDDG